MKIITKKLGNQEFIWDATAYKNKGYWYILGKKGAYGRPASRKEFSQLGKPNEKETIPVSPEVYEEPEIYDEPEESTNVGMSYQRAANIRDKGLRNLIAGKIIAGGDIGESIKDGISEGVKAKLTGLKERLDPLNIARKLTGNLGAALFGKITGRSQEDMQYFTGYGKKNGATATQVPEKNTLSKIEEATTTKVSGGQSNANLRVKDSVSDVLAKLYNLLKKSFDDEKLNSELNRNFKAEIEKEKNKLNDKLFTAIEKQSDLIKYCLPISTFNQFTKDLHKKLKDIKTNVEDKDNDGLLKQLETILGAGLFSRMFGAVLPSFIPLMSSLLLAGGVGVAIYAATRGLEYLNKITPDYKQISPKEAEAALSGSQHDIDSYAERDKTGKITKSGKDVLKDVIKNKPKEAQALEEKRKQIDAMPAGTEEEKKAKDKEIESHKDSVRKFGGEKLLKEVLNDKTIRKAPEPENIDKGPEKVPPRPVTGGSALESKQKKWDIDYGDRHDPKTGIRKDLLPKTKENTEENSNAISTSSVIKEIKDSSTEIKSSSNVNTNNVNNNSATSLASNINNSNVNNNSATSLASNINNSNVNNNTNSATSLASNINNSNVNNNTNSATSLASNINNSNVKDKGSKSSASGVQSAQNIISQEIQTASLQPSNNSLSTKMQNVNSQYIDNRLTQEGLTSTIIADNSKQTTIINQNSDGLMVEELVAVREYEPTFEKVNRQYLRMV